MSGPGEKGHNGTSVAIPVLRTVHDAMEALREARVWVADQEARAKKRDDRLAAADWAKCWEKLWDAGALIAERKKECVARQREGSDE